ncbi:MAG: hypothetical protein IM571_03225, partial [Chitinophagaceae bacterium]|nr:hypothetical protein [Chitinophagaceae bacterium]
LCSYIDADTYSFGWYAICRIVFSLRSKDYAEEKKMTVSSALKIEWPVNRLPALNCLTFSKEVENYAACLLIPLFIH